MRHVALPAHGPGGDGDLATAGAKVSQVAEVAPTELALEHLLAPTFGVPDEGHLPGWLAGGALVIGLVAVGCNDDAEATPEPTPIVTEAPTLEPIMTEAPVEAAEDVISEEIADEADIDAEEAEILEEAAEGEEAVEDAVEEELDS